MPQATRTFGLFPALLMATTFFFFSCNDNSGNNTPITSKLEDPNLPPIGTLPNCHKAGQPCGSNADCCGIGVCNGGVCNNLSCIQNGELCNDNSDCCQGSCNKQSVGAGFCH